MRSRTLRSGLIALLAVAAGVLLPRVATAREVYLNEVRLDDSVKIGPQTLSGCEVRFDANGDVHITAKGYKIQVAPRADQAAPPAPPPQARGPRGFWLISKQSQRGAVQYDVDVFINNQLVKKVRSIDDPVVIDVSRYVHAGENHVRMVAVKNIGERRVSFSPTDVLEVFVGEGVVGGGTVTVDRVHADFKLTAAETQNTQQDFTFKADL